MPFLTGPALYLIVALLCTNGIAAVMWYVNSAEAKQYKAELVTCNAKYSAFADQIMAQGERAIQKAKETVQEQKQITERVSNEYQDRLARLRADYDRMRQQYARSGSGGVSAIPVAAARVDEIPSDALAIAEQCAETTLTLVSLQDWVKEQSSQ